MPKRPFQRHSVKKRAKKTGFRAVSNMKRALKSKRRKGRKELSRKNS